MKLRNGVVVVILSSGTDEGRDEGILPGRAVSQVEQVGGLTWLGLASPEPDLA